MAVPREPEVLARGPSHETEVNMNKAVNSIESIREYYGKVLKSNKDLRTSACCATESLSPRIREIIKDIHPEVLDKFYGCGSPIPPALQGRSVLDLGSGSGRDCFILSKLVGAAGQVIGVDMTESQIETARAHVDYHTKKFGYSHPNVEFRNGYIEDLESLGILSSTIDVVISNCVLNLSPNKDRVFSEIFRVLKPGGELYFSDVFASQRVPNELSEDPICLGECLGGAFYIEDFRRLLAKVGCLDYRTVSKSKISLLDPEIERKVGMINFFSITVRAFKLELEDRCEDYGQVTYYKGTIPECPHTFILDDHHVFKAEKPVIVCGNTASMLSKTRFTEHFRIVGDTSRHHGLFDCGSSEGVEKRDNMTGSCC